WGDRMRLAAAEDLGLWPVGRDTKSASETPSPMASSATFEVLPDGRLFMYPAHKRPVLAQKPVTGGLLSAATAPPSLLPGEPSTIAVLLHDGSVTLYDENLQVVTRLVDGGAHAIRWSAGQRLITLERARVRLWSVKGEPLGEIPTTADD